MQSTISPTDNSIPQIWHLKMIGMFHSLNLETTRCNNVVLGTSKTTTLNPLLGIQIAKPETACLDQGT